MVCQLHPSGKANLIPAQSETATSAQLHVPVAIYTRVSTSSQVGGRFDSCESQAAICRDYLAKQAGQGWQEIACFTDAAYSGSTMNRPGIVALKGQIEAGLVKVVLIFKLERMLRSTDEWAPFRAFLHQHGCRLVSTSEDLTEETPSGRLKNNIMVSVAEYERLNTAEKVRAKMLEQAKRGYWNCGLVPYGYSYDPQKQILEPEPAEAPIVRRIFEAAAALVPLTELANQLSDEGLRTRTRHWQSREGKEKTVGGNRFRSDNLRATLRNPLYVGRVRFLGQDYPAKHTPLVSVELWEKANAAVDKPGAVKRDMFRSSNKWGHLLKGLLYCAHCNRALVPYATIPRGPAKKQYRYYVCGHFQKERDSAGCPLRHVPAAPLESSVVALIGRMAQHPELLKRAIESSRLRGQGDRVSLQKHLTTLDQRLEATGRQINNCVSAIALGGAEALTEEIRRRGRTLGEEKQSILVQREKARQDLAICEQDLLGAGRIRRAFDKFAEIFPKLTAAEQQDLVRLCVTRITVSEQELVAPRSRMFRQLKLHLHMPVGRLVEGLEERLVIEQRRRHFATFAQRTLALDLTLRLGRAGAAILQPFTHELEAGRTPRTKEAKKVAPRHAIHRAVEWRKLRATLPVMTAADFARRVNFSIASVDFHLRLLSLAPEIRTFLLKLKEQREIRYFGMMRMIALTKWDHARQVILFAALRDSLRSGR
jgi:DNA invertase Pin-like site-specific DNA recombinase